MNRRSFFGFAAAAPIAGKMAVSEVVAPALAETAWGTSWQYGEALTFGEPHNILERARSFDVGASGKDQAYRTGYPEIDALRSVSGVHKKRMERRMDGR